MKNLWAPWRMTYIQGEDELAKTRGCIFCVDQDKAGPDKDRLILWVGRLTLVMMNRYPYNNGHLLVAPRRHVPDISDLDEGEMTDLLRLVRSSIEIFRKDSSPHGFNVGLNLGVVAGAGVADHLHFHLVPRWHGDTNFMTVLGEVRVVPEHIQASYDRLLSHYQALRDRT
ncbi:MAG: HIT domain-containing protein [Thermodesulfobacteriota bacterium]